MRGGMWIRARRGREVYARRREAGLSLFGALLALALLGMMIAGGAVFLETRALEERGRLAALQLQVLSHAGASFATSQFTALLATPREITLAELRTSGALPAEFTDVDVLGRGFRVLVLAAGPGAFDLLVTETVAAGDVLVPTHALLEAGGGLRLGLVAPELPGRLTGPAIDADITGFRTVYGGAPAVRALATLERFDQERVFGDQLFRVSVTGFPLVNVMETALDLGGNDVVNAGTVEAVSLVVEEDLTVLGNMEVVIGELVVGSAVTVTDGMTVGGTLTANGGIFTGTVASGDMTVTGDLDAASVSASGMVTGGSFATVGEVVGANATLGSVTSARVSADRVDAGTVEASGVEAATVRGNGFNAAWAGFSQLVVGSCSGC